MNTVKAYKNRKKNPLAFVREYLDVLVFGCNGTDILSAIANAKADDELRRCVEEKFEMTVEQLERFCVENKLVFVA